MTTEPTTKTENAPAPAPPQSVRIETTLWWEDNGIRSLLSQGSGNKSLALKMALVVRDNVANPSLMQWSWRYCMDGAADPFTWFPAPTREAAKATALQAVMGAIGAREVSNG